MVIKGWWFRVLRAAVWGKVTRGKHKWGKHQTLLWSKIWNARCHVHICLHYYYWNRDISGITFRDKKIVIRISNINRFYWGVFRANVLEILIQEVKITIWTIFSLPRDLLIYSVGINNRIIRSIFSIIKSIIFSLKILF